jgi:hypothetical protein
VSVGAVGAGVSASARERMRAACPSMLSGMPSVYVCMC